MMASAGPTAKQDSLFEDEYGNDADITRSLLDQLLTDSRLYRNSADYKNLLVFVAKLRNFAPFNAMLLQVQKPGLSYAASARDWRERFERYPKDGARPLLILWPFGPVALVYDVQDTEGKPLPEDASSFVARGPVDEQMLLAAQKKLRSKYIALDWVDEGDNHAGRIRVVRRASSINEATAYDIKINRNHHAPVKFATLAHELGHMALGHLGPDKKLGIPSRPPLTHTCRELEAESVAYIVCERNGVTSKSQYYLSNFVSTNMTADDLDIYQIMRAAGQVEELLGLSAHAQFDKPKKAEKRG